MKAAITAAERGFDVQLWEKSFRLGGTLLQAGEPDFKQKDGAVKTMGCDTVVIAAGYLSNNELEDQIDGKVKDLSVIGDAFAPRKIMTAIHEAYHTIRLMK